MIARVALLVLLASSAALPQRTPVAPSPGESSAAVAPDEDEAAPRADPTRIFFARKTGIGGWSILSVAPDGGDERVEVPFRSGQGEYEPSLSPDGSTLIFNTYRYGGWKIATKTLGKDDVVRWTPGGDYFNNPAFSPDGRRVLYEVDRRRGADIALRALSGGEERNLTASLGKGTSVERGPAWMPDGRSIVFSGEFDGRRQLHGLSLDEGAAPYRIGASEGNDFAPAVSPDGERIAFYSDRDGHMDVFLARVDGTDPRNLTASLHGDDTVFSYDDRSAWALGCAWSPDGTQLVFVSLADGNCELFVIGADGTGLRRITHTDASELTPCWGRVVAEPAAADG